MPWPADRQDLSSARYLRTREELAGGFGRAQEVLSQVRTYLGTPAACNVVRAAVAAAATAVAVAALLAPAICLITHRHVQRPLSGPLSAGSVTQCGRSRVPRTGEGEDATLE
ncbi:hypothetical protein GCM10009646_24760 [Streptomyces aureus]